MCASVWLRTYVALMQANVIGCVIGDDIRAYAIIANLAVHDGVDGL